LGKALFSNEQQKCPEEYFYRVQHRMIKFSVEPSCSVDDKSSLCHYSSPIFLISGKKRFSAENA